MESERYYRQSTYVGDQLRADAAGIKNLVLAVFAGLLVMQVGLRMLPEESTPLLVKVMGILSMTIAMGAVGTYLGRNLQGWLPAIGLFLVVMAGIFVIPAFGGGLVGTSLLLGWGVLVGMMLGPLVSLALAEEGPGIVVQALTGTTAIMLSVGAYTLITGTDFRFIGRYYFIAVFGLLIVGLIGCFFRFSRQANLFYSLAGVAIFSIGLLYKFSLLARDENTWDAAVRNSMRLFISFANLFSFILQFLLSSRRR